jgi:CRP-like cAMP-binding protein
MGNALTSGLAKVKALQSLVTHYSPLSSASVFDLQSYTQVIQVPEGGILVREGQHADTLYFIVEGAARAYYSKDGKDVTDWFAFENDFICAIVSYFMNVPSPHFIEVLEDSILLSITRDAMQELCSKHHDIETLARVSATKTMLQLQQRIVGIQFESAEKRYENLLKIRPDIVNRIPLRHIASYLGITQETLSRIRARRI